LAYRLAPADPAFLLPAERIEQPMQHATIYFILAASAGLAGEFIDSLERLQIQAIGRALTRQRERLTSETHRLLHRLVTGLGEEIRALGVNDMESPATAGNRLLDGSRLKKLELRSTDLKTRLRAILKSLEEPEAELPSQQAA
jgi:hypothetical protein